MRYIKSFTNDTAIQAAVDDKSLGKPYVALNDATGKIDWNGKNIDYSKMYLTFEILSDGDIRWYNNNNNPKTIEYRKNGGVWTTIVSDETASINVSTGDILEFRGDNISYNSNRGEGSYFSGSTAMFDACGNIMSMVVSNNFSTVTTAEWYAFQGLFRSTKIRNASKLILPATTIGTKTYADMFTNCENLVIAPVLPAPNLAQMCYMNMFQGCSNLNYIKCLAESGFSNSWCLLYWLDGVSPTGTFVKKAGVNWPTGASGIPEGWTVIEE